MNIPGSKTTSSGRASPGSLANTPPIDQVQCPNCGGFRVSVHSESFFHRVTGEDLRLRWTERNSNSCLNALVWLPVLMVSACIFGVVAGAVAMVGLAVSGNEELSPQLVFASVISGTVAGITSLATMFFMTRPRPALVEQALRRLTYRCVICGYLCTWPERASAQKITVRTDLIAKGYERLEREKASDLWWL